MTLREKVTKYGVLSGPHSPVFGPNTGKYGPEKTPYLETLFTQCEPGTLLANGTSRFYQSFLDELCLS